MSNNSLSHKVYEKLKDLIIKLELRPEEPLVESRIAAELSVSRTPIREALIRLSRENLVTLIPSKGAFVISVSPQNLEEVFLVREALEGIAAGIAACKIPDSELESLEIKFSEAEKCWGEDSIGHTVDEIHQIIIKYGGNTLIEEILNNLAGQIKLFQNYALEIRGRDKLSYQEHKEIYMALKFHKSEMAEKAMRKHIKSTKKSLLSSWIVSGNETIQKNIKLQLHEGG